MGQAAFTINLPPEKQGFFLRMPQWFGKGKKISPAARAFAGRVFGVSKAKNQETELWTSYDQIEEELGICRRTVASSVSKLKDAAIISENTRTRKGTSYKFTGETGRRYDIVPLFLYTADIMISGVERRLTKAQVLLLGHMMTECKRPKNNGACEGSIAQFSRKLNIGETTIKKAIKVLLKAGLIYRTAEDKGINAHKLTIYRVNRKLYEYERRRRIKAPKVSKAEKAIAAADARAEREAYYALRKQEMAARAEKYILKVYEVAPKLKELDVELRKLQLPLAKAELDGGEQYQILLLKKHKIEDERSAIYKQIGADERRTRPKFYARCKKCQDSGFLPNGQGCTCHLERSDGNV